MAAEEKMKQMFKGCYFSRDSTVYLWFSCTNCMVSLQPWTEPRLYLHGGRLLQGPSVQLRPWLFRTSLFLVWVIGMSQYSPAFSFLFSPMPGIASPNRFFNFHNDFKASHASFVLLRLWSLRFMCIVFL